jgi:signal transduction histidine kinase
MLLTEDRMHLEVVSYRGPSVKPVESGRVEIGQGIAGTVAAQRRAMIIRGNDVDESLAAQTHPERGIRSSMCVPLIRQDELLGVLNLNETDGKRFFSEHDLEALGLFAEHAAIAIGNARIFEQERQTIQQLEELDRLKSDFVATVSHELKTPLTAIIGSATTLSRRGARMSEEQKSSFIDMIERQGQRLLRLVEDILTSAKIESGAPRMRRELVDLRAAAEVIIQDLRHSQVGVEREIELRTVPDNPQVWGDLSALQQILTNLIENALKYSEQGPVTTDIREGDHSTTIAVADKGRGISSDQVETIFDRFHQADSSITRGTGGFGLGLYIVKSLVDAHNGEISVASDEGVGTTFTVVLPKRSRDRGGLLSGASRPDAGPVSDEAG